MPFINDTADNSNPRTIDKERGIALRDVTPFVPGMKPRFVLEWGDQEIPFGGERQTEDIEGTQNFNVTWTITYIALPEGFKHPKEEIFQVISEALDTYGDFFNREFVENVAVGFDDNVFDNEIPVHWMEETAQ